MYVFFHRRENETLSFSLQYLHRIPDNLFERSKKEYLHLWMLTNLKYLKVLHRPTLRTYWIRFRPYQTFQADWLSNVSALMALLQMLNRVMFANSQVSLLIFLNKILLKEWCLNYLVFFWIMIALGYWVLNWKLVLPIANVSFFKKPPSVTIIVNKSSYLKHIAHWSQSVLLCARFLKFYLSSSRTIFNKRKCETTRTYVWYFYLDAQ